MAKNRKPKLTRAELNELGWQQKKAKKKSTGNKRGSRANPEPVKLTSSTTNPESKAPRTVHAIPIYLPSQGKVLVAQNLTSIEAKVESEASNSSNLKASTNQMTDFVVKDGNLNPTAKATSPNKPKDSKVASSTQARVTPSDKAGTLHLGKAVLRRLEKLGVPPGQELAFLEQERAERHQRRQERNGKVSKEVSEVASDHKRVKTRDYKAGRNTDYASSQALAEKQLGKRKTKRSAEELLADWENVAW